MKQRLEQFLSAENLSKAQFADAINVARASVSHIFAGRNNPGYEFIVNLMDAFPDLNIEWLLKGKGKMYKSGAETDRQPDFGGLFNSQEPENPPSPSQKPDIKEVIPQLSTIPQPQKSKVKKIVLFFDDNTYQEFC